MPQAPLRRVSRFDPSPVARAFTDQDLLADEAEDCEPAAPEPDVLVLVVEDELVVVEGAAVAGVDVVAGLVVAASEEAGVFAFSVSAVAGLSAVSLPPGFILSE